jgi:hypothetical protein
MLHIPDYIRYFGPAWCTWAFPMARFCGKLGSRVTSRLHPYATLSMYLKRAAQFSQLKMVYMRVWDHVSTEHMDRDLTSTEMVYAECESLIYFLRIAYLTSTHTTVPNTILQSPRNHVFRPDLELRRRICLYFVEVYRCELAYIRGKLPDTMTKWGKVRIANGGDKMRG